ncbi:polysaccharide pyruvyl transferase family protein [Oceanispirochaeta crateris]|uniref:Polysaccharide pyruvyl transferase family protein n=1 Tax=Oceanispirochaeta crateris TaxID=2518645 RepID=A0A5C1QK52_9SPIO|nr:polysaccharide pyruvyl transferase family protein [Oceanispirochaeta crateris]QEN06974.1 polysaccharide pyruvyl transferase family protein [Oceanispirochaeta crateris]
MRKIGIYTHWNVPNYGTFLQAYALQKVLENIFKSDDIYQIAYAEKSHLDLYYGIISAARTRSHLFLINPKFYLLAFKSLLRIKEIKRTKKFIMYYKDIKNTGELTNQEFLNTSFDYVFVGSDIIWDFSRTIYKMDKRFFGIGLNTKEVISYAASFGSVKKGIQVPEYVINGLNKMKHVSVRDEKSAKLVKQITGKYGTIVIDPTFLWDFWDDNNIPIRPVDFKYIIVYGSYFTKKNITEVIKYAKEHNLKIICLDSLRDHFNWCDITITQDKLHPFLWCSYLKHAEVVMTCTYHGLIFSLIYKKRIVMNPLPFIMDKASSFIDFLGLTQVLTEEGSFKEKADWDWDYSKIDNRIEELKEKSLSFIQNVIIEDDE